MCVHIFIYIFISFIYLYVCVICICINIYVRVCTVHISICTYWVQTCTSHTKKKDFIMSFLCASLRLEKFGRSILCKQRMNHSTNFPLTWHPVSPTLLRFPNTRSTSIPKSKEKLSRPRTVLLLPQIYGIKLDLLTIFDPWIRDISSTLRQPNDGRCIERRAPSQSRFLRSDLESQRELLSTMAPTVSKHVKAVRNFWVLTRHYF